MLSKDLNLLYRTRYWFNNMPIDDSFPTSLVSCESLALVHLFKSNFHFSRMSGVFIDIACVSSLISIIPEIQDIYDEIIKIDNGPQNGFGGRRVAHRLEYTIKNLNVESIDIPEFPRQNADENDLIILQKARSWYKYGHVGASSSSICTASVLLDSSFLKDKPNDIYDMTRCVQLIWYIPEIRNNVRYLINSPDTKMGWKRILSDALAGKIGYSISWWKTRFMESINRNYFLGKFSIC